MPKLFDRNKYMNDNKGDFKTAEKPTLIDRKGRPVSVDLFDSRKRGWSLPIFAESGAGQSMKMSKVK